MDNADKIEPLAHWHVMNNPTHHVIVSMKDGLVHEVCQNCEWWNDQ